jgi:sarcosine oxidase subunit beta
MTSTDIIIIGGGIAGCSTAFHLSSRGTSVVLLEKGFSGGQASGVNAGGVRQLMRDILEIPLAVASQKIWYNIETLLESDCGFIPCGQISIAENEKEMHDFEKRVDLLNSHGYTHEKLVNKKTLLQIVPAIASNCVGGLFCREDGAAEPYKVTRAFFNRAKQLGANIFEYHPVETIEKSAGKWRVQAADKTIEAPILVNCAGAWGGRIAEMIGDHSPLTPKASVLTVTARVSKFLKPVVLLEGRRLSFKQMTNGTVLIGGGFLAKLDFEREKSVIDFGELKIMAQTVVDLFPFLSQVPIVRCWPGIMGMMSDNIPVIGPSENAVNAYHAFGFSGHGFQLGPIIGQLLSEMILDGRSSIPIDPFRIERFTKLNQ